MGAIKDAFLNYTKWGATKFTDLFTIPFTNAGKTDGLKWHLQEMRSKTATAIDSLETSIAGNVSSLQATALASDAKITTLQNKIVDLGFLSGGTNVLIYDDLGKPSMMVRFPKMKMSDLDTTIAPGSEKDVWHPVFYKNGVLYNFAYISKHINFVENNRAYSQPGKDPKVYVTFDQARTFCKNKGAGWHLMTQVEWDFIALWSKKNGTMPRGNNYCGRDIDAPHECGAESYTWLYGSNWNNRSYGMDGANYKHTGRTLTGSGPKTWAHNHEVDGVYDLNANVWEWVDGFKIVDGIAIMQDKNNFDDAESAWINTGVNICAGRSSGQPVKTTLKGAIPNIPGMYWDSLAIPETTGTPTDFGGDCFWHTATGERLPLRGGGWTYGSIAGVFALNLDILRSDSNSEVGFRAAYLSNL